MGSKFLCHNTSMRTIAARILKPIWPLLLLGLASCAHHRAEPAAAEISLQVTEYQEGDRSALLRVENHTKRLFLYHGPYVEFRTNQSWSRFQFQVPEMNLLGRPHRLGPSQSDSWWVRLPENDAPWRTFIEGGWLARADTTAETEHQFKVWSPETLRHNVK
jgi:hypothetical protein